ncbi:MAG: hypothetical protein CMK59_13410 [Proteobacteria bacterium]|nr:hypothetical protein [Pseudomonadota bacterium]
MFLIFLQQALAVPQQLSQQGRLLDSDGIPVQGSHNLSFQIFESTISTTPIWGESTPVFFSNGYYSVVLGANSNNPLTSEILSTEPLYLELQLDTDPPFQPRQLLSAAPYARQAGVAESINGGAVDASSVSVGGVLVVDSSGSWVGPTIGLNWSSITGIPQGFSDGVDDDTQLSEADVEQMIGNDPIDLALGSSVDTKPIVTQQTPCSDGQILVYDFASAGWSCGEDKDTNTQLSAEEIVTLLTNQALELSNGTTVGGSPVLTEATLPAPDWNDLQNVPADLADGDQGLDVECSEGEILTYINSAWECTPFNSVLDFDNDGVLSWNDCDDNDSAVGSSSNDADCDGVVTADDCDDTDASSLTVAEDGDCDGVVTADDCDDSDSLVFDANGLSQSCPASSCKAILDGGYSNGDGQYWLSINGSVGQATCDMSTDGGGWTLALNYLRQGSTNPELSVLSSTLPIRSNSSLGTNESGTPSSWGHAGNTLMSSFDMSELMFYCVTSEHSRVIHFKTSSPDVISYVKTGSGSMADVYSSSYTTSLPLRNNSTLPLHTNGENSAYSSEGDLAMTAFPFYSDSGIGNPRAHWGIKGGGQRWECDNSPGSNPPSHTLHRIWFR